MNLSEESKLVLVGALDNEIQAELDKEDPSTLPQIIEMIESLDVLTDSLGLARFKYEIPYLEEAFRCLQNNDSTN